MKQDKAQYFIAIVPPEPLQSSIYNVKTLFEKKYASKASLRSPAHITLHMPFWLKPKKEELVLKGLESIAKDINPFEFSLDGYGCFQPKVIYLRVLEEKLLTELQKSIMQMSKRDWKLFDRIESRPFHPHITVAFRDLKKPAFYEAWQEFEHENFQETFMANHVTLLKHNGKIWEKHVDFKFG